MMILIMNCKACATTFFVGKKRACATNWMMILIVNCKPCFEKRRNDWQSWSDFQLNLSWKTEMLDVVTVFINVVGPFHVPSKNYQGNRLLVFDLSIVLTKFSLHISRKNVIRRGGASGNCRFGSFLKKHNSIHGRTKCHFLMSHMYIEDHLLMKSTFLLIWFYT